MKRILQHAFSVLISVIFLVFAASSIIPIQIETECGDVQNLETQEVYPGEPQTVLIRIRVRDKQTDLPLSNIKVGIVLRQYKCRPLNDCPEECFMGLQVIDFTDQITNSEGFIDKETYWHVEDEKDKLIGELTVFDPTEKYYPKKSLIQLDRGETSASFTIRLFTDDYLLNNY